MKFLADECCDAGIVSSLRNDGHDVLYIMESGQGVLDESILQKAFVENRILITEDKDFGELVCSLKKPVKGVVLIRIDVHKRQLKWPCLKRLINDHSSKLEGYFVVVEVGKFRFRDLSRDNTAI